MSSIAVLFHFKNVNVSILLIVDLLYSVRMIETRKVVEVQMGDLVGQFLGSTEEQTANKINEAKGGVLLVDEAYRLTPRSSIILIWTTDA